MLFVCATCHYGNHQSALSVADCADELTARIKDIVKNKPRFAKEGAYFICNPQPKAIAGTITFPNPCNAPFIV